MACGARTQLGDELARNPHESSKDASAPSTGDGADASYDSGYPSVAPFDCSRASAPVLVVDGVSSFAIDGDTIYFATASADQVNRFSKRAGTFAPVAQVPYGARVVAAAKGRVFWSDGGNSFWTARDSDSLPTRVMDAEYASLRFAVDGSAVYGVIDDRIVRLSTRDGTATILTNTNAPAGADPSWNVIVANDEVIWNDPLGIGKVSENGGSASVLAAAGTVVGYMAADDAFIFFPRYTLTSSSLSSVPLATGDPISRLAGVAPVGALYVAASVDYVYWLESADFNAPLHRIPKAGGAVEDLTTPSYSVELLLDDGCLYWITAVGASGQLEAMRLPE